MPIFTPLEPNSDRKPSKTNIVTGQKCVDCAKQARLKSQLAVRSLLGEMLRQFINIPDNPGNIRGIGLFTKINPEVPTQLPEFPEIDIRPFIGTDAVLPLVLLAIGGSFALYNNWYNQGVAGAITDVMEMLDKIEEGKITAKALDESCCRKYLLSQSHPRRIVTEKVRKRE